MAERSGEEPGSLVTQRSHHSYLGLLKHFDLYNIFFFFSLKKNEFMCLFGDQESGTAHARRIHVWKAESSLQEWVLSFHILWVPGDEAASASLLLSHLTGPSTGYFKWKRN